MIGPRAAMVALGALAGTLLMATAACSAFNPTVGPYRDAGASSASCEPSEGTGYGGYGAGSAADAGSECGDAS